MHKESRELPKKSKGVTEENEGSPLEKIHSRREPKTNESKHWDLE
jgi:hypothetical protein